MDDRQPVSLARRVLSYLICSLVAVQPVLPAVAAQITPVTPGTKMDKAGNGVPVVNIATPNGAGVSHNQYQQYNVGQEGLILNNATGQLNRTQLGGLIQNNPHLKAGHEAHAIINEVTGASRSQLRGYTEVAGKAANVMVANPYGITCNGCGFINTPNVTLTTGKPQLDVSGKLSALEVTKGSVIVEGKGLDGSSADAVAIIARATEINAGIYAKDLSVTVGANRVGADGSVTPIAGEGPAPSVAVDTGALGGMYTNRIHLVSGEKGVGINLGNLAAKQGDIRLDTNGKLTLSNSLSSGALTASGTSIALNGDNKATGQITVSAQQDATLGQGTLASDAGIAVTAKDHLTSNGTSLTAGGDIRLKGSALTANRSTRASSGGNIQLQAQNQISNSGQFTAADSLTADTRQLNNSGALAASAIKIKAGSLQNHKGASVAAARSLTAVSDRLLNQGVLSAPVLDISSAQTENSGLIQGATALRFSGQHLTNMAIGTVSSDSSFGLDLSELNNAGLISSGATLSLSGDSLTNAGEISAAGITANNSSLSNQQTGLLLADSALQLKNGSLSNAGQIAAGQLDISSTIVENNGTLQGKQLLQATGQLLTNSGTVLSGGQLTLKQDQLDNRGQMQGQQFDLTAGDWQNSGNALSEGDATIAAGTLDNSGKILAQQHIGITGSTNNNGWLLAQALTLQGDLVNGGLIQGTDALAIQGATLVNQENGQLLTAGKADIRGSALNNQGSIQADQLDLKLENWQNAGSSRAASQLSASVNGVLDNSGTLISEQALNLLSSELSNGGTLAADRLDITSLQLTNAGLLQGNSALSLSSANVTNTATGKLITGDSLSFAPVTLTNAGLLQVAGDLSLTGQRVTNQGRITATNLSAMLDGSLNNDADGLLLAQQQAVIQANTLNNAGTIAAQQVKATGSKLQNQGLLQGDSLLTAEFSQFDNLLHGQLISGDALSLRGGAASNTGVWQGQNLGYHFTSLSTRGTINGIASLSGTTDTLLDNSGSLLSGGHASVTAGSLTNSGKVMADSLTLRGDALNNQGLWQGTTALDAQATDHLQQSAGGQTLSGGDLRLNAGTLETSGKLQGEGVNVSTGSWQHQGSLLSGTDLTASVSGDLNNQGDLLSQAAAQIDAQNLNNSGRLLAEKDVTLSGSSLNNSGTMQGDTLAIRPTSVTNQGSLIGLKSLALGPAPIQGLRLLAVQAQPARVLINSTGAQLLTQGTLHISGEAVKNNGTWQGKQILLDANSLVNGGAIQSAGDLQLNLGDTLTSVAGSKITANGTAALIAQSFTNQGQWIARNLTLQSSTLNNSGEISGVEGLSTILSGALTQQQNAALLSGGTLDIHAATVDNAGSMQGKALLLNSGGVTNSGRMQGDNSLQLNAGGRLTNSASGTLLSQSGLTLSAPELYNYGLIQGASSRITTGGLSTNSGKILSSADFTLNAPQLINNGWLQASQLTLNAASASNGGTLMANQQATLTGTSLQNQGIAQGHNLTVNYAQLTNSGTLLGTNQLNVKATNVTQQVSGKLFSGSNLLLESTGFDQLGQVVALGDATLKMINGFTARNILAAGNRLSISSKGAINNQGTLQGQALTLSAGGGLTNNGQITIGSGDSSLSGTRITMNGSGTLQGGGNVTLISRSDVALNGFTGTRGNLTISSPGSIVNAALLYAGQNLYLYANSIKNQRGDVLAGNSLWMQRDAAGNANGEVINTSGTIESQNGDITVRTASLVNQREGLVTQKKTQKVSGLPAGAGDASLTYQLGEMNVEDLGFYLVSVRSGGSFSGNGSIDDYAYLAPNAETANKRFLTETTTITAQAKGGSARISAGRNLHVSANRLDNLASSLLAKNTITLSGNTLNNTSWFNGVTSTYLTYKYDGRVADAPLNEKRSMRYFHPEAGYAPYRGNNSSATVTYQLSSAPEYETTYTGDGLRAVIQAGGSVNASFSSDISNTSTTSNAGWAGTTVSAPALNHLAAVSQVAAQQRRQLTTTDKVVINSPEWRDQLQNALQQVNGGTSLQNAPPETVGLSDHNGKQQGSANLGKPAELASASAVKPTALGNYGASAVDTSAYPLPTSTNGYFVPGDSSSPYLITLNPKLNGLGQLDSSLFNGLSQLLGKRPGSAPQETRQQYTDMNTFLGSSYLLGRLNLRPEKDYRFLGDAAFDTRYVSNAVLNQTGSRYLNGMGSDLDQMRYLMDNAAASKQSLGLQFGVSLTAAQVASLDKSILWWEATSVNGQTVMVPKVYLSGKDAAMNNGSVIAGNNVMLSGGNITNSASTVVAQNAISADSQNNFDNLSDGLIKAGGNLQLGALNNINNVGSTISGKKVVLESINGDINNTTVNSQWTVGSKGALQASKTLVGQTAAITSLDALSLKSGNDITITGASLNAGGDLLLNAWHDLSLNNIATGESRKVGNREAHSSGAKSSTVTSGGNLMLVAGQDITSQAAALAAEGDIGLKAGHNINLNAEESGSGNSERGSKKTVINETVRQQGTEIVSGGSTTLLAGNDIISQAATITAKKDLALQAGHDVNITTATESDYAYREETKTRKKLFSKKTTHTINEDSSTRDKSSALSGNRVSIIAGNDLLVKGSSVVGENEVGLKAGRDLNITTATETETRYRLSETKKSGMFSGGGIGVTFGSASSKQELKQNATTESQSASTIGSTGGNVTLVAGRDAHIAGSDVIAKQNISLVGGSVKIDSGNDTLTRRQSFEQKQSGLTLQLSSPITDALLSLGSQVKAAGEAGDDRLKALRAVKALESAWAMSGTAGQSATALANGDVREAGIKIALNVGASKSKSSSEYNTNVVSGSSLNGGGNVAVVATGAKGTSGDLTLAGSNITGGNVTLAAAHDLNLVAASNSTEQKSSNKSSGWSAGVHVAIGQKTGVGVQASGYMASGAENGSSTTYVNSRVNARDSLTLSSGNDTLLSGAQALGNSISVNAGNNLILSSLQDTDNYRSKQQSASGGFTFTFGTMTGSFGLSLSQTRVNSEYASVGDQSGLFAGNGGYDIFAGHHTQLNGAVIASTADAANNRLSTGTLGWGSIKNHAEYHASSMAVGISGGNDGTKPSLLPTLVNMSGSASGTTRSAVADGTLVIRDKAQQIQDVSGLSHDTANANGHIDKIFNKEKVGNQLAFAQGVQELAGKVVGDVKAYKLDAAAEETKARLLKEHPDYASKSSDEMSSLVEHDPEYKAVADKWGTGGTYSMAATAVAGALGGLSANNPGAAASGAMAPFIANQIKKATTTYDANGKEHTDLLANTMAHAVAAGVLARMGGRDSIGAAAGAAGAELTARAIIKVMYPDTQPGDLSESQKQTISTLSQLAGGFAGGIAADSLMGSGAGAIASKNAVENNALSLKQNQSRAHEMTRCRGNSDCENTVIERYKKLNAEQHQSVIECTGAQDCVNKANEVSQLMTDYANRTNELMEKSRLNGSLSTEDQYELSILQGTSVQLEADRLAAIHNALMSGDAPEAKQLAINSLVQAAGTSAAGIAAGVGKNKPNTSESSAANGVKNSPETQASVDSKLTNYLLAKDHLHGGSKAEWFDKALGFNKENSGELAKQVVFEPSKAVQTSETPHGVKYDQVISITGVNGRVIDVKFGWIKNNDGVVRLVTAIPTKK